MNDSSPSPKISTRLIVAGVMALLVIGGFTLIRSLRPFPGQPTAAAPDVPRAELHLRDGRLYRDAETNAFTGWMLEHYEDGALRSRSAISNGLLHGLSEGWYTNGQMQVSEYFRNGISHGLRAKWSASGTKLSEGHIVEGKFDGTFRKWHENGVLAEQVEFTAGLPVGVSLAYFPSGFLKARVRLQAGSVAEQQFWQDGEADKLLAGQEQTP